MMDTEILAQLVIRVLNSSTAQELSEEEAKAFKNGFNEEVCEQMERMRCEKRRVFEEYRNLAIR